MSSSYGMRPSPARGGHGWFARTVSGLAAVLIAGACGGAADDDESVGSVQQLARIVDPATPIASVGWVLKGTAVISGSAINLTPATGSKAGTAFYPTPVDPTTITTSFHTSITGAANNADGMTFMMADATRLPANAVTTGLLGATGGGLGFSGIPGVATLLDTFKNATDPSSNYVGVSDGPTSSGVPDQLRLIASATVPSLQGQHDFTVTVRPGTIAVTMDGASVLSADVTLPSSVYFGFTAGTGGNPPAVQSVSTITVDATQSTGVPVLTASAILPGAAPSFVDRTAFLYTGTGKVQTGMAAGTIVAARAAVLRGHVVGDDKTTPATGTVVTVLGHPEYGQTLVRADGWFDLAVNGGTSLTVDYQRSGHLPVQRTLMTRYNGTSIAPEVVLTVPYAHPTDRFTAGAAVWQSIRGSLTAAGVDADAARQAVVLFPPSTHITNYAGADGVQNVVQITELTRDRGKDRMPGDLPPSSGYTYAVELGIPAAAGAGVTTPQFDKTVVSYVTNFTASPNGEPVPVGTYDRSKGAWVGDTSGVIVKIVSRTGGYADLDVDGTAGADPTLYAGLGIADGERQKLGALTAEFPNGTSLWRVTMTHFSNWDFNWGFAPPPGAGPPPPPDPPPPPPDDPCQRSGSIIGCESQTLAEEVQVVGTGMALRYQSDRAPGFLSKLDLEIGPTASSPAPTATVLNTYVEVQAAGRKFTYQRTGLPAVGERYSWTFDGLDAYGRAVRGTIPVDIRVGYEFGGVSTLSTKTFGDLTGSVVIGNRAARTATYWTTASAKLRVQAAQFEEGLGGWNLTNHHHFDPAVGASLGDGRYLHGDANQLTIDTYVGGGTGTVPRSEGMSAKDILISTSTNMHFASNGDLLLLYTPSPASAQGTGNAIDAIHPNGTVSPITGLLPYSNNSDSPLIDGGEALHAQLPVNTDFAVANDGTIFLTVYKYDELWKITTDAPRLLRRISRAGPSANSGSCPSPFTCGDGGQVGLADFRLPLGPVVMPDGSLAVADWGHSRVRRIDVKGVVSSIDSGTFYDAMFLGPNGELFGKDSSTRVYELTAPGKPVVSGSLSTSPGYGQASVTWCESFSAAPILPWNGGFLVGCRGDFPHVRYVSGAGVPTVVAGSNVMANPFLGDGGPATRANMTPGYPGGYGTLQAFAARAADEFFTVDSYTSGGSVGGVRVRRVTTTSPIAAGTSYYAADGDVIHNFDLGGRHVSTRSALTGTTLYSFGYDAASGYLTSITDRDGLVTTITRSGSTITLTAPFGQQTTLGLDANKYLSTVMMPNTAEVVHVTHGATGLLTSFQDPRANTHSFVYDTAGRLTKDTDAVVSSLGIRLTTAIADGTHRTVTVTSPEGRAVVHDSAYASGTDDRSRLERRVLTRSGTPTTTLDKGADGLWSQSRSGGSVFLSSSRVLSSANDPRWGSMAPFVSSAEEKDGARTLTRSESRSATLSSALDPYSTSTLSVTSSDRGVGSSPRARGPEPSPRARHRRGSRRRRKAGRRAPRSTARSA